jgi:hypothetical protein
MTAETVPAGATVKPKLTGGQRVTAALAGVLGFLLHTIGWGLIVIALGLTTIVTFLSQAIRSSGSSSDSEAVGRVVRRLGDAVNVGTAPLIVMGVIGAVLWVLALFVSRGILRRGGHHKPWAITWAGLGVGILMSWVLGAILAVIASIVSQVIIAKATRDLASGSVAKVRQALQPLLDAAGVFAVIALALVIVIGWVSWSWMAHALRPTVQQIAARDARDEKRLEADRKRLAADADRHEDQADAAAREQAEADAAERERHEREDAERRAQDAAAAPAAPAAEPTASAPTTASTPPAGSTPSAEPTPSADDRGARP